MKGLTSLADMPRFHHSQLLFAWVYLSPDICKCDRNTLHNCNDGRNKSSGITYSSGCCANYKVVHQSKCVTMCPRWCITNPNKHQVLYHSLPKPLHLPVPFGHVGHIITRKLIQQLKPGKYFQQFNIVSKGDVLCRLLYRLYSLFL